MIRSKEKQVVVEEPLISGSDKLGVIRRKGTYPEQFVEFGEYEIDELIDDLEALRSRWRQL